MIQAQRFERIPERTVDDWRGRVEGALRARVHLLSLFGRRDGDEVLVTALLQRDDGAVEVERARVAALGYASLTPQFPALHIFERELHEQTGLSIHGHPWCRPVRFEGAARGSHDRHPFHVVAGKEVHEVAVGPIHAGVIEPGAFRFMCLGETVHHLEICLGYQHRGVEALLLRRDVRSLGPLVESVAGDTSVGHAWAYSAAIEALTGQPASPNESLRRAILLEFERVGMHLATLAGVAADVGFLQGAATFGRLRTTVINTIQRLCGSRFGRGAIRPGSTRATLDGFAGTGPTTGLSLPEVHANLTLVERDLQTVEDLFTSARTVRHRLEGVGSVSPALAEAIGLVGPVARAAAAHRDLRVRGPAAYDPPVGLATRSEGDCWGRTLVRLDELQHSLTWLRSAFERAPHWTTSRVSIGALTPSALVVALVEGLRGEIVHALETDGDGRLVHYKVQDPSLRNWLGLALAVRDNEISDFPICNKTFDLSYCGNDL
ncbi:MAG: NADH-quinone oxidoreductase subunit C [Myxococcales bacterium]|nr:NADH-quinone oxidoreductase subunit C [Myxococcales bacterium]